MAFGEWRQDVFASLVLQHHRRFDTKDVRLGEAEFERTGKKVAISCEPNRLASDTSAVQNDFC